MIYTTFALAHKANACTESYKKMAEALGGITKYGKNAPIPLDKIIEICGLQDAIWALQCTSVPSENILIEFACRCAEHVLHLYEDKYPNDNRSRQAIEAARVYITNKSSAARASAGDAGDAARAAAGAAEAAAGDAAGDAARVAAEAAAWAARAATWAAAGDATWAAGAAEAASWAAAGAAAWAAAGDAARVAAEAAGAAGDAEIEWQTQQFLELLRDSK